MIKRRERLETRMTYQGRKNAANRRILPPLPRPVRFSRRAHG